MTERTKISDVSTKSGQKVTLMGWVHVRRDHGKLIFIDLRDRSGLVQMVVLPQHTDAHTIANTVRNEWVIRVTGNVNKRPEKMVKANTPNGDVEIEVTEMEVLNEATTPPFSIDDDGRDVNEEVRMRYRYIDLRRKRMQKNISLRHEVIKLCREYLSALDFYEVETPMLTRSTPEGSRDYLVPSRLYNGNFYALPQSPQQYKQLLMVAGIERYFQVARCFRDEDTRGDRQPEFTQLDMELSFIEREEIMRINEELLIKIVQTLTPEKKIQEIPFPRISYKEAMEKYNSDKPDIRKDKNDPNLLAFCWVVDFPFFEKTDTGAWTFTHNPFSMPMKEHLPWLMEQKNIGEILTTQYDIALNGYEIGGGSIRGHRPEILKSVFKVMGFTEDRIERNFGHMMEALASGAPPHGGIAWGLDRLLAILSIEPNIREVIAFPKTGEGKDPMMQAPSPAEPEQLTELGISFKRASQQ